MVPVQIGLFSLSWANSGAAVCAANTRLPAATDRERTISICLRLTGLRANFRFGASPDRGLSDIPAVRIQSGKNSVFDRPTEQVDLGWRWPTNLDVLDAYAVEVLPRG